MSNTDEEDVLRKNLRVGALSPEALARIRRATEAEWRAQVEPVARRRWAPLAAAASLVLVTIAALGVFLARSPAQPGEPFAQLTRAQPPGVVEQLPWWREAALDVGAEVRAGQHLAVRGGTLLTMRGGGELRAAPHSEFEVISPQAVRLLRGELYVDIAPGARAAGSFTVLTAAGEFRHQGTQFALAVIDGATRLRVREGSVLWHAAHGDATVNAGTEVIIDPDLESRRRELDAAGDHWAWAESMAPEVEIDNRPLGDFLDWVARETGRKLVIADEPTRQQVATIRMHGNVRGLEPLQALKAVMASTSLRLELSDRAIRVSFTGVPAAQPR